MSTSERRSSDYTRQTDHLPVIPFAGEIKEGVSQNPTLIVVGETGSGKTTQIPLMLLDVLPDQSKIAVAQPRRLAAISVARHVAAARNTRLGVEIGYQVRFDDQTTRGTRINFYTDGLLLRKALSDPSISEFDAVMVDEAHERSLNVDLLLGLLKDAQKKRKSNGRELKIVVTSATLEEQKFADFFDNAPIIKVPGRQYPVDTHFERSQEDYVQAAASKARQIIRDSSQGNVLIFMPGVSEISRTISELGYQIEGVNIFPLHGQMTPDQQDRIFREAGRKIVIATNIAETSVTIPDVRFVIDTGLSRHIELDLKTGIEALVTVPTAKSQSLQRAGRAGRTAEGDCYFLFSEEDFAKKAQFQKPEMQRVTLTGTILQMKKIGITDVEEFEFIDPPEEHALSQAVETLNLLGALDDEGNITEIGERMSDLPLEPHAARSIVEAVKLGCAREMCSIMAFSELRSPFISDDKKEAKSIHARFRDPTSDFLTLLNVWRQFERNQLSQNWADENYLNYATLRQAANVRSQLLGILGNAIGNQGGNNSENVAKAVLAGYSDHLLVHEGNGKYRPIKREEQKVSLRIHPSSVVSTKSSGLVVAAEFIRVGEFYAATCQAVEPSWVPEVIPFLITSAAIKPEMYYSKQKQQVVERVPTFLKGAGSSKPSFYLERPISSATATRVFARAIAQGEVVLPGPIRLHNEKILSELRYLWHRPKKDKPAQLKPEKPEVLTPEAVRMLGKIYLSRMSGLILSSIEELASALAQGNLDLRLKPGDFPSHDITNRRTR